MSRSRDRAHRLRQRDGTLEREGKWDGASRKGRATDGLSLPHIAQDLDVACDLFLGAFDALLVEVIDEELVAPAAAAAGLGVGGIGRVPIFTEACTEKKVR